MKAERITRLAAVAVALGMVLANLASLAGLGIQPAAAAGVPSNPAAPTAIAGNASVALSWTAPSDNGSPITGYIVTQTSPTPTTTWTFSNPATSQTITGLQNGTSYRFTVKAVNAFGSSTASLQSAAVVPATVPSAPTALTAVAHDSYVVLSWTQASDGGKPVTSSVVTPSVDGAPQSPMTFNGPATTQTITGLTDGVAYAFSVHATNAVGSGPESSPSSPVTPLDYPDAPTAVTATPLDHAVSVSWTAPTDAGAASLTGYVVTTRNSAGPMSSTTFDSSTTTRVISGLTNGTYYRFTVAAVGAAGTGDEGISSFVAPAGLPDRPTNVTGISKDASVALSWQAADGGGRAIASYVVTPYLDGIAQPTQTFASATPTQIVVGLTNESTYTFTVRATTVVGSSPESVPSAPITPHDYPDAPTGVSAIARPASALVSWTAPPDSATNPPTGYIVTAKPAYGATVVQTSSSPDTLLTVLGLTNGVPYTFTVKGLNAFGTGPDSTASTAITPVALPGAPQGLTASLSGHNIALAWTASDDGGLPILGYTITPYVGTTALTPIVTNGTFVGRTISGLTAGTTYTFSVVARTTAGSGAAATTAPLRLLWQASVVTGTNLTQAPGQVTLTWAPPLDDGGTPITGYRTTCTPYGKATITQDLPPTASSMTCSGLVPSASNAFSVAAITDFGLGVADQRAVTPPGPPTTPPTNLSSPESRDSGAYLFWTSPVYDGGPWVTGYLVTPYLGSVAQPPQLFEGVTTVATVTGLTNGATYTFTVAGVNAYGVGVASVRSSSVLIGRPNPPTAVTGVSGGASVALSWTATSGNGSPITGYVVTPILNGVAQATRTFDSPATTQVITGLTNGATYTFKVQAVNQFATGPSASSAAVLVGLPGAPAQPTGTPGNLSATLTWPAGDPGGSPVTTYRVTPYIGTVAQATRTFNSPATTQVITNLTNGAAYTFTVTATNSYGTGPASTASAPITPALAAPTPPSTPAKPTVSVGTNQLTVSWAASTPGTAPLGGYTVIRYDDGSAAASATTTVAPDQTSLLVAPLSPASTYRFTVTAFDVNGPSAASPPSDAATPAPVLPAAPPKPTVTREAGPSHLRVSWSAPDGGSAPIVYYEIYRYADGDLAHPLRYATPANTPSIDHYELSPETTYQYAVRGVSTFGEGAFSELSDPITAAPTLPGWVLVDPVVSGVEQLTLTWHAPPDGSAPVTSYTIKRFDDGATASAATTVVPASQLSLTTTGLTPNSTYQFTIAATSAYGTGPTPTITGSARPLPVLPSAPAKPTVARGSGGQLVVSWVAPAAGSTPITGYSVERYDDGATTPTAITTVAATPLTLTVSGLSPASTYRFAVIALARWGVGSRSPQSDPASPNPASVLGGVVTSSYTGLPIAGIRVRSMIGSTMMGQTTTAADGTWTLTNVAPGNYSVQFADLTSVYRLEYWQDAPTQATGTLVPMGTIGLHAFLEPTNLVISGRTLANTTGQPVENVRVRILSGSSVVSEVRSAADGSWRATGLMPGTYSIQFYDSSLRYRLEYWQNAAVLSAGTLVTAGASGIDARLDLT